MGYELEIGEVLDRRFKIAGLLSEGGMAKVFRALDLETRGEVAIKVPLMKYESSPVFYRQFEREEEIGAMLEHPAVARVIPVAARSRPYIVTELMEGQTLDTLIVEQRPVDVDLAVRLAIRLCEVLTFIHGRGVVHRDLKPGNIMMCRDGSLRIFDFGLAITPTLKRAVTGLSGSLGTLVYMAPEQVRGKRGDARVDVYALGSILYELTTGRKPYPMEDHDEAAMARLTGDPVAPRELNPQITAVLEEVILRAIARDPEERYPSCAAMQRDLERPQDVALTGRAGRLIAPRAYRPGMRLATWWMFLAAIPVGAFVALYIASHRH